MLKHVLSSECFGEGSFTTNLGVREDSLCTELDIPKMKLGDLTRQLRRELVIRLAPLTAQDGDDLRPCRRDAARAVR